MADMTFLGTNVDLDAERLPLEYTRLVKRVKQIRLRWLNTPQQDRTLDLLKELYSDLQKQMVRDEDGNLWTVSPLDLQWRVRTPTAKKWAAGHPSVGVR
ncbi:hypothetical protein DVS28_b0462 (plasmid) [Euzebya pacifica]|uniref:Uncharacterized protein n=1 Tax=Euzebya pacifica TaxID=1608957 RepID=A0A346Y6V5_9ACTN|nr:hypothetical protein [Euzebya pacifica]AXV10202.1 hypothetical protein DVS28_b0462 [Euzebya pacifica]